MDTSPAALLKLSIAEAVLARALALGDRAALLVWRNEAWSEVTFRELASRVEQAARNLVAGGLQKGDRAALLGPNSPEWGMAYLAILRAGGVAVPLDRLQTVSEWLDVLARSGATRLFVAHGEGVRLQPFLAPSGSRLRLYSLHGDLQGTLSSLDELATRSGSAPLPEVSVNDVASLIFTSGTTGRSKGVMLSHANILANARGMLGRVALDAGRDRFLSVLPMSHCYECTCGFIAPLLAGIPVYFARGFAAREVLTDLKLSGATLLLGVPLLFEKFAKGIERSLREAGPRGQLARLLWAVSRRGRPLWRHRFGRLALGAVRAEAGLGEMRYLVSGGAPLPVSLSEHLESLGVQVLQGYGLTEASPVATLTLPTHPKLASVGPPLPGVEVRIHEPTLSGDGEVQIRGAIVMQGYWQDEEATRQAIRDGWLCTGDLGRLDHRGHLYITGRLKNVIVSPGGKNISPEEIELAVHHCPAVAEILVYGRPTASGSGEDVCARVFPDLDYFRAQGIPAQDSAAQLVVVRAQVEAATSNLAQYKRIVHYDLVAQPFDKTTSHKIKRFKNTTSA